MGDAVMVVGVGNALRGDDSAGLEVVRLLRERAEAIGVAVRELEGEGLGLLDIWDGARAVVLVDSVRSGAAPGTVHRIEATDRPLPATLGGSSSTHAVGVGDAIELARALGRLPSRLVVYGVEGRQFETGSQLSASIAAILESVVDAVLREAHELEAAEKDKVQADRAQD